MTAELAGNVMFVLIVVTGGVIVHQVILHTNPYAAVPPVGIFVLTTNGTMLIKTNDGNIAAVEGQSYHPPIRATHSICLVTHGTGGR